ncbi:hypothetical protein SASPL_131928 [Salvia splendens]|uniref:Gibberellin receptor GID1 n=1 Tax=Salvia splendens TaxID=180675 RepID=A0A8X8ZKR0_SALSN|nr:hypothetical protein SASPL_131928 [Salvia splendens]
MADEILHDFFPMLRVYKNGRIERLMGVDIVPPSLDPATGVQSKDVEIAPEINLSARIYLPPNADPTKKLPLLVYYHGGGFVIGSAFSPVYQKHLNLLVAQANVVRGLMARSQMDRRGKGGMDQRIRRSEAAEEFKKRAEFSKKLWGFVWVNPGKDPNISGLGCGKVLVYDAGKDYIKDRGWYYKEVLTNCGWKGEIECVEVAGEDHVFSVNTPDNEVGMNMI